MTDSTNLILTALRVVRPKPPDSASSVVKKHYSERMSAQLAFAIADAFRARGLKETRPAPSGVIGGSGAERRLSGGLGAKKVDVSWSEESGLLLGVSIKTINFRDERTKNFQKNLTNRRGDMLFEAVTLHQRFPYSVLVGLLCLDAGSEHDGTAKRNSTFANCHPRLRLFTHRSDPAGRSEQFELFYVALVDGDAEPPVFRLYEAGSPTTKITIDDFLLRVLSAVAERNPDFYQIEDGRMVRAD